MAAHERELIHWLSENWADLRDVVKWWKERPHGDNPPEKPKQKTTTKHKEAEGGKTD